MSLSSSNTFIPTKIDVTLETKGERRGELLVGLKVCSAETFGCQSIWVHKVLQLSQTVCVSVCLDMKEEKKLKRK